MDNASALFDGDVNRIACSRKRVIIHTHRSIQTQRARNACPCGNAGRQRRAQAKVELLKARILPLRTEISQDSRRIAQHSVHSQRNIRHSRCIDTQVHGISACIDRHGSTGNPGAVKHGNWRLRTVRRNAHSAGPSDSAAIDSKQPRRIQDDGESDAFPLKRLAHMFDANRRVIGRNGVGIAQGRKIVNLIW